MIGYRCIVLLAGLGGLSACATAPVPVLGQPGPQKEPAAFQADEVACRIEASRAVFPGVAAPGAPPAPAATTTSSAEWADFFAAYAKCQQSHGNTVVPVTWTLAYAAFLGNAMPFAPPVPFGPMYGGPPGPVAAMP